MSGKRILVTGASRGIGRAISLRLASDGAELAVCASSHGDELDELVSDLRAMGRTVCPLLGDLSDPSVPARFVQTAALELGGLDAVVSNAGIAQPSMLVNLDLTVWERIFAVNTRGPWVLASAAYPWLKREKGTFVAISSMSGVQPYSGMGAYSASKAALIMLIRQLAQEWSGEGIRANCISPGLVRTPLSQSLYDVPEIKSAREALVPVHRIAEADTDISGIVAFLIGDDARYITGQNILADGGLLDSVQTHLSGRPKTGDWLKD